MVAMVMAQILGLAGFLLGISCYVGIAGQIGSLYLFGVLLPCFRYFRLLHFESRWLVLGLILFGAWWIFPLANWLNLMAPHHATVAEFTPDRSIKWMKSLLPSSSGFAGLLLIAAMLAGKWLQRPNPTLERGLDLYLQRFWQGLMFASFAFGIYFVTQHLTGIDYRGTSRDLGNHNLMGSVYRVPGFFGHPLTMASVALSWSVFGAWLVYMKSYVNEVGAEWRRFLPPTPWIVAFVVLNFAFVLMSGGRTAGAIGLVALSLIALAIGFKKSKQLSPERRRKILILSLGVIVAAFMGIAMAFSHRVIEIAEKIQGQGLHSIERFTFWRVYWQMFCDNVWYGQGEAQLGAGLRDAYYQSMGLGSFPERYNAHNVVIEVLGSSGILGLVLLVAVFGTGVNLLRRIVVESPLLTAMFGGLMLATLCNALHGLTQNTLFDSSVYTTHMTMLWVVFWTWTALKPKSS